MPISFRQAKAFLREHHYTRSLPRPCRLCLGGFTPQEGLRAVVALGYGMQPGRSGRLVVRGAAREEYLEILRLCLHPSLPRNSGSRFLALCARWVESNLPQVRWLTTFADGVLGHPGYVYQAAGWIYLGRRPSVRYLMPDGALIHPRTFTRRHGTSAWGHLQARYPGIKRLRGYVYRYLLPLGPWRQQVLERLLLPPSPYPKREDCVVYVDEAVEVVPSG